MYETVIDNTVNYGASNKNLKKPTDNVKEL